MSDTNIKRLILLLESAKTKSKTSSLLYNCNAILDIKKMKRCPTKNPVYFTKFLINVYMSGIQRKQNYPRLHCRH